MRFNEDKIHENYFFSVTSDQSRADASLWTKTLEYYSGYAFDDFQEIFIKLAKLVVNARSQNQKHQVEFQDLRVMFHDLFLDLCYR